MKIQRQLFLQHISEKLNIPIDQIDQVFTDALKSIKTNDFKVPSYSCIIREALGDELELREYKVCKKLLEFLETK